MSMTGALIRVVGGVDTETALTIAMEAMVATEMVLAVLVDITMAATVATTKATTRVEVAVAVEATEEMDMRAMAMATAVVVEEAVVAATTTWATTIPRRPTLDQ